MVAPDAALRHDDDQTPGLGLDPGVVVDLSLSVPDFESSPSRSGISVLALVKICRGSGSFWMSEAFEEGRPGTLDGSPVGEIGPWTELNLLGLPIIPGVEISLIRSEGMASDAMESLRLLAFVIRYLYTLSSSGRTNGTDSWFRSSSNIVSLSCDNSMSPLC